MAGRHKTETGSPAPPPDSDSAQQLRAKYLQLCRKYEALVRRLEVRTANLVNQRVSTKTAVYRLGFWALNATGSGLALVKDGAITIRNARWHALDAGCGGWRREDVVPPKTFLDLSQAALAEAARLPRAPAGIAVRRYRSVGSDRVVEMRLERADSADAPVVVLAVDVTELARTGEDVTHMREALQQSENFAVLGELASAIAHDLGNTVRALTTRIAVLAQDPAVVAGHADLIGGLQESAEAALASLRKLHELARSGRLQPGPVDLAEVVRHASEVLRLRQVPGAQQVELRGQLPPLPPVHATASELSHVFITLFTNARDAMPRGGIIGVRAERLGERVRVAVSDQGSGIAPEHMAQLFQPFFTTKGKEGTGLGLWLAQSSLRRLGGSIDAHNRRGGGAEFVVELPIATTRRVSPRREPARRRERIARRG